MATKKQKKWGTILGAIAGGIITYRNTKGEEDRFLEVLAGIAAGAAGGYVLANAFGPDDTVNYSCFHKKERVYEGICYDDRRDLRIIEHKANGKIITKVRFDKPKPRSEAVLLEKSRIKRHRPKYNIVHNC